ncbi:aldolase [Paenibacillus provencensis]|uniref:Aldolase n=2 Tax=Bacteria TaxID=2 RepID=A0ABW3PYA8_9BACL|nr:aldolase [Paenibacillus sp. MER 78]MCM3127344.1 aldolase [Paenibacillus sp. MER 78]
MLQDKPAVSAYLAFGLTIQSELPLPELTPSVVSGEENIDVTIQFGDLSSVCIDWRLAEQNFQSRNDQFLFQIPEVGAFHVVQGRAVTVMPHKDSDLSRVRLYLLGTCMGVLLLQRNILPLHGSAVAVKGYAFAFVGESGAGKSTLSAAFVNRGYRLISDDVIAVCTDQSILKVSPAYPQQKLNALSLDLLTMNSDGLSVIKDEWKYAVPRKKDFSQVKLPLAGVYELIASEQPDVQLHPVSSLEGIQLLQAHTYRLPLVKRIQSMQWHFNKVTEIASQVELCRLHRPKNSITIEQLVNTVLQTIERGVRMIR